METLKLLDTSSQLELNVNITLRTLLCLVRKMPLRQETFIRGLHVYKIRVNPSDALYCELDRFWMNENPNRYSIAVLDGKGRKVKMSTLNICINKLETLKIRKLLKFCQKCVKAKIEKSNSPVIYVSLGLTVFTSVLPSYNFLHFITPPPLPHI